MTEAGFGFTAPTVAITGGNPTTPATAVASGGVDNLTVTMIGFARGYGFRVCGEGGD